MIQQILIIGGFLMIGIGFALWPEPVQPRNEIIYDAKEVDFNRFHKALFRDVYGNEWRLYAHDYVEYGIGETITLINEGKPKKPKQR